MLCSDVLGGTGAVILLPSNDGPARAVRHDDRILVIVVAHCDREVVAVMRPRRYGGGNLKRARAPSAPGEAKSDHAEVGRETHRE